jgi:hypothetical protein
MLHAFQLSNGTHGLVFATTSEHAARVVFAEYSEEVAILDPADVVCDQYRGLAFLTTESE